MEPYKELIKLGISQIMAARIKHLLDNEDFGVIYEE